MVRFVFSAAFAFMASTALANVEIQEVVSPGGIEAWLVEEQDIPFVALEIRMGGGANLDREGKRGAANLMAALIEEGAGERDAVAFQTARESLASSFYFSVGDDAFSVSARMLTETRGESLALLREALVAPRFDEDAIERVRAQVLSGIAQDAQDPSSLAADAYFSQAFGEHPYGSSSSGTTESVTGLTRDDIVQSWQDLVTTQDLSISAVGDITAEELGLALDALFAGIPATGPAAPEAADYQLTGGITVVEDPSPQSMVYFGQEGLAREDEDYFAAYILNHILGAGGFDSRLMQEVREKRGFTYGIGTYLVNKNLADMLIGTFASSNETVGEAIEVIRGEWLRMSNDWLTEAELERAKTYLTGEYPLRFDGNATIAQIMVGMQSVGLSPDYVVRRNDMINAVTLQDLNRVASSLFNPEALHFVVVGQPVGVDANQ